MLRRTVCILLLPLFAAACGGDGEDRPAGQRTGAQADSAGMMAESPEEMVTPAESAAAARDVQRHADSMRDAVRRASGAPDADEEPSAPAKGVGNSKEERYEACMRQANVSDEPMRTRLAAACANIRNQPGS